MTPRHDLLSLLRICSWSYFQLKICVNLESWPFTFNLQPSLHPAMLADVNTISIATLSIFWNACRCHPFVLLGFFHHFLIILQTKILSEPICARALWYPWYTSIPHLGSCCIVWKRHSCTIEHPRIWVRWRGTKVVVYFPNHLLIFLAILMLEDGRNWHIMNFKAKALIERAGGLFDTEF